jgi:hypothetical protein
MISRALAAKALLAAFPSILLPQTPQSPQPPALASKYDPRIFQSPIPGDQLQFMTQFDGAPSNELIKDGKFRKILRTVNQRLP